MGSKRRLDYHRNETTDFYREHGITCGVPGLRCYGMDENARYGSSARDTPRLQSGMSSCILNVNRLR